MKLSLSLALAATKMPSSTNRHEDDNGEVGNNIHLISMALEHGLFLICSLVTPSHGGKETYACAFYKEPLLNLDITNQIVRMGNRFNAGNKLFQSSHLDYGLKIIASL